MPNSRIPEAVVAGTSLVLGRNTAHGDDPVAQGLRGDCLDLTLTLNPLEIFSVTCALQHLPLQCVEMIPRDVSAALGTLPAR